MDLKTMQKSSEKFTLRDSITLDELHGLMTQNDAEFPGRFKLKKGLFGKSITFDVVMQTLPKVTVKDNLVTVRRFRSSSTVSVGGMPAMDFKAMSQTSDAIKSGGLGKAVTGGQEYFLSVCDAMRALLANRVQ